MKRYLLPLFLLLSALASRAQDGDIYDPVTLRNRINEQIIPNNNRLITGAMLNKILNGMVNVRPTYGNGLQINPGYPYLVRFGGNLTNHTTLNGLGTYDLSFSNFRRFAISLGGDSTGDMWYRNAQGYWTRIPGGSEGKGLVWKNGVPGWDDINATGGSGSTWTSSNLGITNGSGLQTKFNIDSIRAIWIDRSAPFPVNTTVNAGGKVLKFSNGGFLTGPGSVSNVIIDAPAVHIADTSVSLIPLNTTWYARWWGLHPDSSAAYNTRVAQRISAAVNAIGGGVTIVIDKGLYRTGHQTFANGTGKAHSYLGADMFFFQNCTKPVVIEGSGAEIKLADGLKYGSYNPTTGAAFPYSNVYTNQDYVAHVGSMIRADNCKSITVKNITLNGNLQNLAIGGQWGDMGIQIAADGFRFYDNEDVTLDNVTAIYHGLDGLIVDNNITASGQAVKKVTLLNSKFNSSGRQGYSWVGGNHTYAVNCQFNNTGKTVNTSIGQALNTSPGAGLDIEPEGGHIVENGTFTSCQFNNNAGVGMLADDPSDIPGQSRNVTFDNCEFQGTSKWAAWPKRPYYKFIKCTFNGPLVALYQASGFDDPARTTFTGCNFFMDNSLSPTGQIFKNAEGATHGYSDFGAYSSYALFENCTHKIINHAAPFGAGIEWRNNVFDVNSSYTSYTRGLFSGSKNDWKYVGGGDNDFAGFVVTAPVKINSITYLPDVKSRDLYMEKSAPTTGSRLLKLGADKKVDTASAAEIFEGTPQEEYTVNYRNGSARWAEATGFKNIGTGDTVLVKVDENTIGIKSDRFYSGDESIIVDPIISPTTRSYDFRIANPVPQAIRDMDISQIVFRDVPATVSQKWVLRRTLTLSAVDTLQPDKTTYDSYFITAQNQPIHFKNPEPGKMIAGDMITINVEDNGQARAITWGTAYRAKVLPSTTTVGEVYQIGLQYSPSGGGIVEVSGATTIPAQYVRSDQNTNYSTNTVHTFPTSALYASLVIGGTNSHPSNRAPGSVWREIGTDDLYFRDQSGTDRKILSADKAATVTNKRNIPSIFSSTSQPSLNTITPDLSAYRRYRYLGLSGNVTVATPVSQQDGEYLLFWFKDNGVSRSITWTSGVFAAPSDWPLPEATTPGKVMFVAFEWHQWALRWVMVSYKDNYDLVAP